MLVMAGQLVSLRFGLKVWVGTLCCGVLCSACVHKGICMPRCMRRVDCHLPGPYHLDPASCK